MASSEHVTDSDCVHIIPKLVIVEPPASSVRYRYECERGSASSIKGASSSTKNKTHPRIKVIGYQGSAYVQISCVTKDTPYRPHPHNLVGRSDCVQGICCIEIPQDSMTVEVSHLGIQRVKRTDMVASLKLREKLNIDPFRTGFSHAKTLSSVDVKTVRLCFQVFLKDDFNKSYPLSPIVTDPIEDEKDVIHLRIMGISDCVCYVDDESKKIILLCDKIINADIQIRFFEELNGEVIWESFGDFSSADIHKQVAITFRPPKYKNLEITQPVRVFVELRRPSNGDTSEPIPFEYLPIRKVRRKYPKLHPSSDVKSCHRNISEMVTESSGVHPRVALSENQSELIRLPSMSTSLLSKWNKVNFCDKFEFHRPENSLVPPGMNNFNAIDKTSVKQAFHNCDMADKLNIIIGEYSRTEECPISSCHYSLVPEDRKTNSQSDKFIRKTSFIHGNNFSKNFGIDPAEIHSEKKLENDVAAFCLDPDPNYSSMMQSPNILEYLGNTDPSGTSTTSYLNKDTVHENTSISDGGLQRHLIPLNLGSMCRDSATPINDIHFDPVQFDFKNESINQPTQIDETSLLSAAYSSSSNLKSFKVNTDDEFTQCFTENRETNFENMDLQQQIIDALMKKFD